MKKQSRFCYQLRILRKIHQWFRSGLQSRDPRTSQLNNDKSRENGNLVLTVILQNIIHTSEHPSTPDQHPIYTRNTLLYDFLFLDLQNSYIISKEEAIGGEYTIIEEQRRREFIEWRREDTRRTHGCSINDIIRP